jgi:hypothetical protein
MAQRLKRWESPRKEGRNDKGRGGSARQRQIKKRTQMLRKKLKDQGREDKNINPQKKRELNSLFFCAISSVLRCDRRKFRIESGVCEDFDHNRLDREWLMILCD